MFSDVLITCDYDRTLTARDSTIPERNIEAIRYFIENGGAFTLNTGRSLPMVREFLEKVPFNAPLLLYNGSAAYDVQKGEFTFCHLINRDLEQTVRELMALAPDMHVEFQGVDSHCIFEENAQWEAFTKSNGCRWEIRDHFENLGPFMKLCVYGQLREASVAHLFHGTHQELERMDQVEAELRRRYGDSMEIIRVAPRIIDLHAPGISKGRCARELQAAMGRKILVCIGDERNDLTMLDAADYAYCPSDAAVADRYENVCDCKTGAIADVIYEKIPQLVK